MRYPISPFEGFLKDLDDATCYSIQELRLRAIHAGLTHALTQLTETLIWHRHFHEFPSEGDCIGQTHQRSQAAWTGARWKTLLPKPESARKSNLIERILQWVA